MIIADFLGFIEIEEKRIISPEPLSTTYILYFASDSMPDVYIRCRTTRRIWTCSLFFFCPVLEVYRIDIGDYVV